MNSSDPLAMSPAGIDCPATTAMLLSVSAPAVGGVVMMMFLFYLDALELLIGAEINSEVDFIVLGVPRGARDFKVPKQLAPAPNPPKPTKNPPSAP